MVTIRTGDLQREEREHAALGALLTREHGGPVKELQLGRRRLRGGLEASSIELIVARFRGRQGREQQHRVVIKRLRGALVREAAVYERLVATQVDGFAPRLLQVERTGDGEAVLYLEALRAERAWPWRDVGAAQAVLNRAARLHSAPPTGETMAALAGWDYEAELVMAAGKTVERLAETCRRLRVPGLRRGLRWASRLAVALPRLRRQLLAGAPFGTAVIHGDLHPGNVVLRRRRGALAPVLIDWGRARLGSPLEDVSCWLQTLASWEPEARRRHDTLLAGYLAARDPSQRLDGELRTAYWLAGASNALSGALLHHLGVLLAAPADSAVRGRAEYAVREWLRVLRRADAFWS